MTQLCAILKVDPQSVSWDAATETLDGDVRAVLHGILTAGLGEGWNAPPAALAEDALEAATEIGYRVSNWWRHDDTKRLIAAYLAASAPPAPADVAALLADLHELDWGALPAVGRAAAAIEAMWAAYEREKQCYLSANDRAAELDAERAAAEARVVQLEEHASKQAQDIVTLGQLAGRAAVLEARVVQLEAALRKVKSEVEARVHGLEASQRLLTIIRAALSAPTAKGGDND
jgi:hypothetical protein